MKYMHSLPTVPVQIGIVTAQLALDLSISDVEKAFPGVSYSYSLDSRSDELPGDCEALCGARVLREWASCL